MTEKAHEPSLVGGAFESYKRGITMRKNLLLLSLLSQLLWLLKDNSPRRLGVTLVLIAIVQSPFSLAKEDTLEIEVAIALGKASAYLHAISTNGGYAGIYSQDLMKRYGEGLSHKAQLTEIWVQPPGTPSVGQCFLRAHRITGDAWYLSAAVDAALALAWGQRSIGGWGSLVDVGHLERDAKTVVRKDGWCTFDDNTTQGALQFLIDMDEVMDDPWLTEAVELGLAYVLEAQYDNGAWPQSYPPRGRYADYYTFNDRVINDCIKVMIQAHRTYGKSDYLESTKHGGDFIILSQLPSPQSGWAQQYSQNMKPAWARSFEPPGVCSAVTCSNIYTLLDLYLYTKDKKYLEPVPKAIAWLKSSKIGDNLWARLYEVGTNRPIYGDREDGGKIHYDYEKITDREQRSYAWQGNWGIESALVYYERTIQNDVLPNSSETMSKQAAVKKGVSQELQCRVRDIVDALDDEGRWLRDEMIYSDVFVRNAHLLCNYLEAVGYDRKEEGKLFDPGADVSENNGWKQEWTVLTKNRRSKQKKIRDLIQARLTSISIHEAASKGNLASVRALLKEGVDVNVRSKAGDTPLELALSQNRKDIVELLIENGADVSLHTAARLGLLEKLKELIQEGTDINMVDPSGLTALHYAARQGHTEIVEFLLENNANVDAKNKAGQTPIDIVEARNRKEIVELLIKNGATVSSIHIVAGVGNLARLRAFLENGVDINAADNMDRTPLHYAAQSGQRDMAEFLITHGADMNAKDAWGRTPLHWAVVSGYEDLVELLVAKGADLNAKNNAGQTPLNMALSRDLKDIVGLLVERGADVSSINMAARIGDLAKVKAFLEQGTDVDMKDTRNQTALHYAAREGYKEIVELLLEHGADVNSGARYNRTAAEFAMNRGHTEIVELLISKGADISPLHLAIYLKDEAKAKSLIERGADVNKRTPYGTTSLDRAVNAGLRDIVRLLVDKGADINAKDNWYWTPLHSAIYSSKGIVELLIAQGANLNAKDGDGRTPLWYAEKEGRTEIVELLKKQGANE